MTGFPANLVRNFPAQFHDTKLSRSRRVRSDDIKYPPRVISAREVVSTPDGLYSSRRRLVSSPKAVYRPFNIQSTLLTLPNRIGKVRLVGLSAALSLSARVNSIKKHIFALKAQVQSATTAGFGTNANKNKSSHARTGVLSGVLLITRALSVKVHFLDVLKNNES